MTWKVDHELAIGGFPLGAVQHDFLDRESLKRWERIWQKAAEEAIQQMESMGLIPKSGWKGLSSKILELKNLLRNRRETLPFKIVDTVIPGSTGVSLVKGHLLVQVFSSSELRFYAMKSPDGWNKLLTDQPLYLGQAFEDKLKIEVPGPWEKEIHAIPQLVDNAIAQVNGRIQAEKNRRIQEFAEVFK